MLSFTYQLFSSFFWEKPSSMASKDEKKGSLVSYFASPPDLIFFWISCQKNERSNREKKKK